ncbi:DNA-3-methyladenine glycosylase I [Agreia sp. COWG]|uniref:DNA-3-methyladenine glycosylase I n=1 Tax=Agreia sp. COWG TaxID=2773266 RepID=UPI0019290AB1|nr:DNA-3-methyladenine glycosylase I [Agreia sp. COWG]CAD6000336.1 DNA-3-methyladenine glycosylase 1 [Agreia sp. COWG]
MTRELLNTGEDGVLRCGWVNADPDYQRYHDEEWGHPVHGDNALFEMIALEGFQSGLSWLTILKRRAAFRAAFVAFDITRVSEMDDSSIDVLAADSTIIRNRQKIAATLTNARVLNELTRSDEGALDRLVWRHAPATHARPLSVEQIITATDRSHELSGSLRAIGLKFVGPVTMHALMQAAGLINDHAAGCPRGDELEELRA